MPGMLGDRPELTQLAHSKASAGDELSLLCLPFPRLWPRALTVLCRRRRLLGDVGQAQPSQREG